MEFLNALVLLLKTVKRLIGSKQPEEGLTSTNLTLAPVNITAVAVAINVMLGTITSSPKPIFKALEYSLSILVFK